MKKVKQSKKRWAQTEYQIRKDRSKNCYSGVPKWFCRILDNSDKRRLQMYLRKIKQGADPDEEVYNIKYNSSSAKWLWW